MNNKAFSRAKSNIKNRSIKEPFLVAYESEPDSQVFMRNTGQQTSGRMSQDMIPISSSFDIVDDAGEFEPDNFSNYRNEQLPISKQIKIKSKEKEGNPPYENFLQTKISKSPYNTFKSQKAAQMSGTSSHWKIQSNRILPLGIQNKPSETSLSLGKK